MLHIECMCGACVHWGRFDHLFGRNYLISPVKAKSQYVSNFDVFNLHLRAAAHLLKKKKRVNETTAKVFKFPLQKRQPAAKLKRNVSVLIFVSP